MAGETEVGGDANWDVGHSDQGNLVESGSIDVFQSGGLVAFTRRLATLAAQASEQQESACFATATILTAGAALEAILAEYLFISERSAYTKEFSIAGVPKKYEMIKARKLVKDHPAVSELWAHRNAIVHSEPENERSRNYGTRINPAGARWAYETVDKFARTLWGSAMPNWFRSDAGM